MFKNCAVSANLAPQAYPLLELTMDERDVSFLVLEDGPLLAEGGSQDVRPCEPTSQKPVEEP
jgi:hypothetical protein